MKIGSNTLFISLLIVTSALSATAHDEKQLSSFPAAKEALTAISGQPRIEYEFKQNTQQQRAVSVFDDGLICYEIGRSKGDLDAQFRLGDEEPVGLIPKEDVNRVRRTLAGVVDAGSRT